MRLVLDANLALSAALRDGAVRRQLTETNALLFAPDFLRMELEKNAPKIARRARIPAADFRAAINRILADVIWVKEAEIQAHWGQAHAALGSVDEKDVAYLACALAVGAEGIWSFDKDFDAQALVPRYPPSEFGQS